MKKIMKVNTITLMLILLLSSCGSNIINNNTSSSNESENTSNNSSTSVDETDYKNDNTTRHVVSFYVDSEIYGTVTSYAEGDNIAVPTDPIKDGYTFTKWDKEVPSTMGTVDLSFNAVWTANEFNLVYRVDEEVFASYSLPCGSSITATDYPDTKEGFVFSGWLNLPSIMPSSDYTVNGYFLSGSSVDISTLSSGDSLSISSSGTYIYTGTNNNLQILINNVDADVVLILDRINLTCLGTTAAISCKGAKSLKIILIGDNFITDSASNTDDAAIQIKKTDNTIIEGEGKLTINGLASAGLYSSKAITINSGSYTVNSLEHGIAAKTALTITGGTFDIDVEKDALKSNDGAVSIDGGTMALEAGSDGIEAETTLDIKNSTITIDATGDGIKAVSSIAIEGGDIEIISLEDGIKANGDETGINKSIGWVNISKGNLNIVSGQDGIQAETELTINNGNITIKANDGYTSTIKYDENNEEISCKGIKGTNVIINDTVLAINSLEDCVHANGSLEISGGSFYLTSGRDGISSDLTLTIAKANIDIQTSIGANGRADDSISTKGIKSEGNLVISSGNFVINSLDDAIHSNADVTINAGVYTITTGDDGIHSDSTLTISGGNIEILKSYEGLEGNDIVISGGKINLIASDDGINAAGGVDSSGRGFGDRFASSSTAHSIKISGGYIFVNSAGDGVDSNGTIEMSGGTLIIMGPTNNGNGSLDYDGTFKITGGLLIAAGSSGMAQAPSNVSTQNSISINTNMSAGKLISISGDNFELVFASFKNYSNIIVSSKDISSGSTIIVKTGGTYTGGQTSDGIYTEGTYSGGSQLASLKVNSVVTSNGGYNTGGSGGFPSGGRWN